MNYGEYVEKMKTIQEKLLKFIDDEDNEEENFENLQKYIKDQQIGADQYDLKAFLYVVINISNNHHRKSNFFRKIERIIIIFKKEIQLYIKNDDIFMMFKDNKRLLLFLIEEKILTYDDNIEKLMKNFISNFNDYFTYLFPEKAVEKGLIDKVDEDFDKKRKIGENDDYICELIRKDSIEEFIIYVNKNDYSLKSYVNYSVFETNSYLNHSDLIEYAAFFGSTQIFKYLYKNNVQFEPKIWLYAIHGCEAEIFGILEDEHALPPNNSYEICFFESIKCHDLEISNYLQSNFQIENQFKSDENIFAFSFHYYNFSFIPKEITNDKLIFNYACKYNHYKIVEFFLKTKADTLNDLYLKSLKIAAEENNQDILNLLFLHIKNFTIIKNNFFYGCIRLTQITLPSSVTKIGRQAFYGCSLLKTITIPSSVTKIGSWAFKKCSSLIEITIPSSVILIGMGTFSECNSLKKISILSNIDKIDSWTFFLCSSLKNITIPSSVKLIESDAFFGCSALDEIEIPSSVIEIGKDAFNNCYSLKKLSFEAPSSIKTIGEKAFYYSTLLNQVVIPSTATSISGNAFSSNTKIIRE